MLKYSRIPFSLKKIFIKGETLEIVFPVKYILSHNHKKVQLGAAHASQPLKLSMFMFSILHCKLKMEEQ